MTESPAAIEAWQPNIPLLRPERVQQRVAKRERVRLPEQLVSSHDHARGHRHALRARGVEPRDKSDCHFRKTATECDRETGVKWLSCTAK